MSTFDQNLSDTSEDSYTGRVWIKENEALIEKLEAAFKATPDQSNKDYANQFYGLKLKGFNFLIDKSTACELLEDCVVYPIPLAESWIVGVTNVRGDVIPIIDLDKESNKDGKSVNLKNKKIIIINKGLDAFGLLINELPKPIGFNFDEKLNELSNLPEEIKDYVEYAYMKEAETWVCIDFASFIHDIRN